MSNTDDENIKKISRMLEIGGTMLAQHCGNCGAPLFRYQGRVLCPVCEDIRDPRDNMQPSLSTEKQSDTKTEKTEVSPAEGPKTPVAAVPEDTSSETRVETTPKPESPLVPASIPELETLLVKKMVSLASAMQAETDVRRISDYLDMIERCMDIMNKMK
ncbi:Sjogren's syndrome/scleroderma autoantigen 1 family protein [Methanolobus bombayensis]|uniref:Sjogren's syndrome/scleroderma autoantigen 1 family protein n=1 Tax=Methanolobus bombayensis TaxID=38023 RepID=UPI001AE1A457|nr:Sjogren's syndrome/scleroderma autoantigen 1 family protein [Methanolobus bombayensis]MBP1910690.1 UPF0148 protein [Methanolobus bombayensis]